MQKKLKALVALVIGLVLVVSTLIPVYAVQAPDISGHWAESQIAGFLQKGLIKGYGDGTFKPESKITRAEFFTIINRTFGFNKTSDYSFSDVSKTDWFSSEVSKAIAAKYIAGYEDGTVKPNENISRQEVAIILCRVLKLKADTASSDRFSDAGQLPAWSKGYVGAIAAQGYIAGYKDSSFRPELPATRAEVVAILSKAAGEVYFQEGTYGPETGTTPISGNVTVSKSGITLKNLVINGNLYLTEGIGDGHITMENVTVKGTTTVSGGGQNSIIVINSALGRVVINVPDNSKVRVVAQGSTSIGSVETSSESKLEEKNLTGKGFEEITVEIPKGSKIELLGDFSKVDVKAPEAKVDITKGTVSEVKVAAAGAEINVSADASIKNIEANSAVEVKGKGPIEKAVINANNVKIEQKPASVQVAANVTATVNNSSVSGTPAGTTPPSGGSGGGGGSSSSGSSSGGGSTNHAPVAVTGITRTTTPGGANIVLTASQLATDQDSGDTLSVHSAVYATDKMNITISGDGSSMTITPLAAVNNSTVTVTVKDSSNATVNVTVTVSIVNTVVIKYLDHATFILDTAQRKILIDPGTAGMGSPNIGSDTDIDLVVVSHAHGDHNNIPGALAGLTPSQKLYGTAQDPAANFISVTNAVYGDVTINSVKTTHFDFEKDTNGSDNSSFVFEVAGLRIVHMGDSIGTTSGTGMAITNLVPTDAQAAALKGTSGIDVLMIPIGDAGINNYLDRPTVIAAIKKLNPKIVIPIHYWTAETKTNFLNAAANPADPNWTVVNKTNTVTISTADIPASTVIWNMVP